MSKSDSIRRRDGCFSVMCIIEIDGEGCYNSNTVVS